MLAVVSPGSSVPWVGFDCIELSGVESPPTEGTGVSVGGEIIAGPETVGSVSSVQPMATLAARNTPSRQVEMSRLDFRYMVMLVSLSAPFKGQCGMSHENDAARRVASGPLMASAAIVYSAPGSVSTATPRTRAGSRQSSPGPKPIPQTTLVNCRSPQQCREPIVPMACIFLMKAAGDQERT